MRTIKRHLNFFQKVLYFLMRELYNILESEIISLRIPKNNIFFKYFLKNPYEQYFILYTNNKTLYFKTNWIKILSLIVFHEMYH